MGLLVEKQYEKEYICFWNKNKTVRTDPSTDCFIVTKESKLLDKYYYIKNFGFFQELFERRFFIMNEIQIFNSPIFGDLRTVIINGKEYFFGIDIATDLMYKRPRKAVIDHCKGVLNQDGSVLTQDGDPIIPEGDVYRLIIKAGQQGNSKEIKEKADELEKWIFDEILPSLRKNGTYGRQKSTQEQIALLAQGTTELYQRMESVENRIVGLEETMTLDYGQQAVLGQTVNKTVINHLGGKESPAYKPIGRKVFAECNGDLKRYFKVNARANVTKKRYEEAVTYAENWKPCTNTMLQIEQYNAQITMDATV